MWEKGAQGMMEPKSNTSENNVHAICYFPVKSWGQSEQKTVDMSGYSDPSTPQEMC